MMCQPVGQRLADLLVMSEGIDDTSDAHRQSASQFRLNAMAVG